jgi:hypothetical protein
MGGFTIQCVLLKRALQLQSSIAAGKSLKTLGIQTDRLITYAVNTQVNHPVIFYKWIQF